MRRSLEQILAEGLEKGLVLDATIGESVEQAKAFWKIREQFGEMQGREGGSIKHDVSVPVANIPAFIEEANAAAVKLAPVRGRCRSATSVTATSTTTSRSRSARTRPRSSSAGMT